MLVPDSATLQLAAAWVSVVAAVGGLLNLLLGIASVLTGRSHWPKRLDFVRRRKPASQEDERRHGMALALNGAAVLIIILGSSLNIFGARDHSLGDPLITLRFVITLVGLAGAMVCVGISYRLSLTVRYINPKLLAKAPPAEPSI
jgi:uncharacterized iron-regulated membrane protein